MNDSGKAGFSIEDVQRARARLAGRVFHTPLLASPMLDALAGCRAFVKAESLQRTGSFKFRGALNKILSLDDASRRRGVITFSAGNHGHAVAAAARELGCPAVIVLPRNAPRIKVENCRWWGAEIVLYDPVTEDRTVVARRIAERRNLTLVPPFDDYDVMAGQGTCGIELCEQLIEQGMRPDSVVVNCSGGGLASGVTEAVRHFFPDARIHVVEPLGYEKMARSLRSGVAEQLPGPPRTLMDGIAGPAVGTRTLEVLRRRGVSAAIGVSDDEALDAMAAAFRYLKLVVEPGGAAGLAALLSRKAAFGATVAVVVSGGNVDADVFARAVAREQAP